jgi:ribosome-binding protein aMBF1 (putative translation factor)
MKASKQKRLEARGWKVGSAQEFLGLTDAENALVELRLSLGESVRTLRQRRSLTQVELAKQLGSSQSRVAKMEVGDSSVSIDLLFRALLQLGSTRQEIGRLISRAA